MKRVLMTAAALGLLGLFSGASPAAAASPAGLSLGPDTTVAYTQAARRRTPLTRPSPSGNVNKPSRRRNLRVPAYQRGSGQQTGGPARELIPRRR